MAAETTYYWQNIYTHGWGTETGAIYSFTTTEDLNPPTPTGLHLIWTKKGAPLEWAKTGSPLQWNYKKEL